MVQAGLSANWLGASASVNIRQAAAQRKSTTIIRYTQRFYSLVWNYQSSVFRPDVRGAQLEAFDVQRAKPPVYVKSIAYGRGFVFFISSNHSVQDLDIAVKASYNAIAAGGSITDQQKAKTILDEADIRYIVLGGRADSAVKVLGADDYGKELRMLMTNGANWSDENPAVPLSYRLNYVDDSVAEVAYATEYNDPASCHDIPFKSPLHVFFDQTNDDKDKDIRAFLRLYVGGTMVLDWSGGKGVRWADPGTSHFEIPILHTFKPRDCTTAKLTVGEMDDSSGWHFKLRILGDLEDGSEKNMVIHSGPSHNGDPTNDNFGYIIGNGRPSGPSSINATLTCAP